MLATLTNDRTLLDRPDWLVERKFDGFRALAFRHGDSVKLLSRNRLDLGSKFPEVVQALTEQPIDQFVLDGEIVAFDRSRMSFQRLQQRLRPMDLERTRHTGVPVFYYIFDLLQVQGVDVRRQALIDRRRLLRQAIHFEGPLRLSVARKANPELLKRACHQGWEGLLVKARRSRYVAGRSREWLKLKCDSRQELVIGGFTDPQGSRAGFGSLLVGYYDDGQFRYAGKVGTGYDTETLLELRRRLDDMLTLQRPFAADTGIPRKGVHWVKPRLVAEVAFSEWTSDGKLRQPRFLGLRPDKPPSKVVRESPGVAPRVDRQGLQRTRIKPDQDDGSPRRRWRRS